MSLCIALIPIALAMRVAMGKENFEKWIESNQRRIPTSFKNERDLISTVEKAGYDTEKWGDSIKTHIKGEKEFLFWELVDGKWTAVFFKSCPEEDLRHFIQVIEKKSGRKIFEVQHPTQKTTEIQARTFPTNFRDGHLLLKTLQETGINPNTHSNGHITCTIGQCTLRFYQVPGEPFNVELKAENIEQIFKDLSNLDETYKKCVQASTYENLMHRLQETNLNLESEEVLEDNSIVVTLAIPEGTG